MNTDLPFRMIRGARMPAGVFLAETWSLTEETAEANISAEHIVPLFDAFLDRCEPDEPMFLFVEIPSSLDEEENPEEQVHRDVYYLDGCGSQQLRTLLHSQAGELLIQDGMTNFGFGLHRTRFELGKYRYNQFLGYAAPDRTELLAEIFRSLQVPQVPEIVSAWDLFSGSTPGFCKTIQVDGKDVYDLVKQLQTLGLYFAERKED